MSSGKQLYLSEGYEQAEAAPKEASRYRKPPKIVVQGFGPWCWAAALESWLHGTPGRTRRTQGWLLQAYGELDRATGRRGILVVRPDAPPPWASDFDMAWAYLRRDESRAAIVRLDSHFVSARLKRGYVYLAHPLALGQASIWHAIVVYGVGYPDGRTLKLAYMNPQRGGYFSRLLQYFRQKEVVFVGWPQ